jgi:hemoglobin
MTSLSYVEQKRAQKREYANAMGIDDALISQLVERFYDTVRKDDLLGPIFEVHVTDWTVHLARIKDFWVSVTLESGRYHGNPMLKHIAVGGLEQLHFDRWLTLWDQTVCEVVPNTSALTTFQMSAKRIASSLLMGIESR